MTVLIKLETLLIYHGQIIFLREYFVPSESASAPLESAQTIGRDQPRENSGLSPALIFLILAFFTTRLDYVGTN